MNHERMTRRDAGEWLLRAGMATGAVLAATAALTGCSSASTSTRRTTIGDDDLYTNRTPSRDPVLDTPGTRALERFRNRGVDGVAPPSGVIPRTAWTRAEPIPARALPMGGINRITIHHDGMSPFTSGRQGDAVARLENIRRAHVGREGWADIGYHYVIDPAGRVYEARPVAIQGAHVKYNNENNLGVMVMGNFDRQRPSSDAQRALDAFVADRARAYRVPANRIYTHRELRPTACPGSYLQRHMDDARTRRGAIASALA